MFSWCYRKLLSKVEISNVEAILEAQTVFWLPVHPCERPEN